ncbi:general stress protein [Sinobaca sp. H24]|uniref:general stress protein n=1 Tax=Sinobaca sp. H24 TaxID=2923376 RepID=UPI0035B4C5B2
MYIITHDKERTNRLADEADANTAGAKEQGIGESIKNVFRKQGDELRAKFQELGYTEAKAEELEDKLDDGKVILVVKDAPTDLSL